MTRVIRDELHDIPIFHEVRNDRELRCYSYKGQNVVMLEPLPPNNLACKQLDS